jgi:acyl carrier protein
MLNEAEIYRKVANHELTREEALDLLKQLYSGQEAATAAAPASSEDVSAQLLEIVSNILHMDADELYPDVTFKELGADSISSVEIIRDINKSFGLNLDAVVLYDYSTLSSLTGYLTAQVAKSAHPATAPSQPVRTEAPRVVAAPAVSQNAGLAEEVEAQIGEIVGNILHLSEGEIDYGLSFRELGVDSISSVEIIRDVNKAFDLNLDAVVLYDYSTIPSLIDFVVAQAGKIGRVAAAPVSAGAPAVTAPVAPLSPSVQVAPAARVAQPPQAAPQNASAASALAPQSEAAVLAQVVEIVSNILHLAEEELSHDLSFRELGVDSISSVEIIRDVNKVFEMNLDAVVLYDYSTIPSLTSYVAAQTAKQGASFAAPVAVPAQAAAPVATAAPTPSPSATPARPPKIVLPKKKLN